MQEFVFTVSDFVASINLTMEGAFPYVDVEGELSNFRVSKNKWVYFDLKDDTATLKCFATVYALPGPLEDGMVVRVSGSPRLHPLYNFSFQVQSITPQGEGTLKRAADLLQQKLAKEGLFDEDRKRPVPYPPHRIAVITSVQSAAYADFSKIHTARWQGTALDVYDVLVQGTNAPTAIVRAMEAISQGELPDVIVMIRGGGSAEDLAAFNDERVVRAVAGSRVPTVVAIGHESDISLAELAADMRASTPSNAAELLTPDRATELRHIGSLARSLDESLGTWLRQEMGSLEQLRALLDTYVVQTYERMVSGLEIQRKLLDAYDPRRPLQQGYALVHSAGKLVRSSTQLHAGDSITMEFHDGTKPATITTANKGESHETN